MFCKEHEINTLIQSAIACKECGRMTGSRWYVICDFCSEHLDACVVCEKAVNSGRNPRLIKAYKSREAALGRQARKLALAYKTADTKTLADELQQKEAPFVKDLEAALKPLRDKETTTNKSFADEYDVVCKETAAVRDDPNATEGQKLDAKNRFGEAMNKYSAACRPAALVYDKESKPFIDRFNEQIAPFRADHKKAYDAMVKDYDEAIAQLDEIIADIERRAVSPWGIFLSWFDRS